MHSSSVSCANILQKLKDERDQQGSDIYPPVPGESKRTLLLLGASRAGKSTIVQVLKDSLYQTPRPALYSATREPQSEVIGGLRIIDMPGFYDRQAHSSRSTLSNDSVFAMLNKQIMQNGPIDLFGFVFHLAYGINSEDIEAMLLVKRNLPRPVRMLLIVTHAEEMDVDSRDKLMNDFFRHPEVIENDLRQCFDEQILFLGSLRYESLQRNDDQALSMEHRNVLAMRKELIDRCFSHIGKRPLPSSTQSTSKCPFWKQFLAAAVVVGLVAYFRYYHLWETKSDQRILSTHDDISSRSNPNDYFMFLIVSKWKTCPLNANAQPQSSDRQFQSGNQDNIYTAPEQQSTDVTSSESIAQMQKRFHDKTVISVKRETLMDQITATSTQGLFIHTRVERTIVNTI